jgi:pantoate--beta-alanine ligase
MIVAHERAELRRHIAALRHGGASLALVPTMGALHDGHVALIRAARRHAARVVASIFVNPLQFDRPQDLARYPRDEAGDLAVLREAGCDLAWLPMVAEMYPSDSATRVEIRGPAERWEGAHRPGHFGGVATVCTKLFLQTGADVAMFGEKDWQQVQVIRRVVRDLDMPITIVEVQTLREPDGLALSSRNRFLSAAERRLAPRLAEGLRACAGAIAEGADAAATLEAERRALATHGFAVDYLALVEPATLEPIDVPGADGARLIAAARLGAVRLIDNLAVRGVQSPSR